MGSLAVLHASELVTLNGPKRPRFGAELSEVGIVRDGGMLVRDGKIEKVGPSDEVEKNVGDAEIVDARGRVVMPGFVDAHTHLVFAGNRLDDFERRARGESYQQIAKAGGGIWSTVEKTRAASELDLLAQAKKHANWFLRCGTTTIEAKSGYGLTVEDELKILRVMRQLNASGHASDAIRGSRIPSTAPVPIDAAETDAVPEIVPTFLGAHAVPWGMSPDEYVELVIGEMLPRVAVEKLAEFCDVFCERGYFDIDQSRKILSEAKKLGLSLRGHIDQLTNSGGAELLAEMSATTADHLEQTDEQGIAALKKANVQPVLLPGSVYALGSNRYPRAREMIETGLAVVLATDFNPGSSPTPSMSMVLSLACTQMKMSPAEAITASTVNAAYSVNRGNKIGSLEVGKLANFVIFDCEDYRELAYWFGMPQTFAVYVRGQRAAEL
jgi:imidazolonepropionase